MDPLDRSVIQRAVIQILTVQTVLYKDGLVYSGDLNTKLVGYSKVCKGWMPNGPVF